MTLRNINSVVAGLSPYKPGKPIEELSRELGLTDIVKLPVMKTRWEPLSK